MTNNSVTLNDLDALKQLKVIRADNEIYRRVIKTYYDMIIQNGDLRNLLHGYEMENKELIQLNEELQDELDSLREDFNSLDQGNLILKKAVKDFIHHLKEIKGEEYNGPDYDVSL